MIAIAQETAKPGSEETDNKGGLRPATPVSQALRERERMFVSTSGQQARLPAKGANDPLTINLNRQALRCSIWQRNKFFCLQTRSHRGVDSLTTFLHLVSARLCSSLSNSSSVAWTETSICFPPSSCNCNLGFVIDKQKTN